MKAPISWLKDFVDIDLPVSQLAHLVTMAGMEVEEIKIIGLPKPETGSVSAKVTGLTWEPWKIVVGEVREVMPHPNADRLVLCRLFDGEQEHIVLTGAPNLYEYKGKGVLPEPLKVAYAKEGSQIYDGHQEGQVLSTLKRTTIRGVESYSMICSEKELGISDEHEGILFLEKEAVAGTPLMDVLGDAVLEINLLPSFARCASILGLAREVAAITRKPLRTPTLPALPSIGKDDFAALEITAARLNPRFVLGLIRDVTIGPSPLKVQRRLQMAGMRPINNIVDATNYAMLELGEPLHAFDYDVLVNRAKGKPITIITRTAQKGETIHTLDGVERKLDPDTILVCDEAGPLSIAGVMGGMESEVGAATRNILLEGASWNMINIRRTAKAQNLPSEAAFRFIRGVHPALAEKGVKRGLQFMNSWAAGKVNDILIDCYPLPPATPVVDVSVADVKRWLGLDLTVEKISELLKCLEFKVEIDGETVHAICPDHRLDIGEGVAGTADLVEEIARAYGYDNIPESRLADRLPPQRNNPELDAEERVRDLLAGLGLQEVISYRCTTPEREARRLPPGSRADEKPYVRIANPLAYEKAFLRHSVLASVVDAAEKNSQHHQRLALFEIGPVFIQGEDPSGLPDEEKHLGMVLAGQRAIPGWQTADTSAMDFYDLKGILEDLTYGLRIDQVTFKEGNHPSFHPGKCALILLGGEQIGVFGELHPKVREAYDWGDTFKYPVLAADIYLDAFSKAIPEISRSTPVPTFPPVLEDMAFVIDESVPAEKVKALILQTGGKLLTQVKLFDIYRGERIGNGKKSMAYNLTYQAVDRTLTETEINQIRSRIIKRLEYELNAKLRS